MRDQSLFLEDIIAAAEKILRYTAGRDSGAVIADEQALDAILFNLAVIGEAVKHVSEEFRDLHPEVTWRRIAGFRDIVIHEYFGLDQEIIADVISEKVPELLHQLRRMV